MTEVCAPTRWKFVLLNQKNQIKFLLLLFSVTAQKPKDAFNPLRLHEIVVSLSFFLFPIKSFPVHFKLVKAIDLLFVTVSWEIDQHYSWRNWHAQKYKGKKLTDKCLDFLWSRLFDFHLASTIFHNFFISKQMFLTSYFYCCWKNRTWLAEHGNTLKSTLHDEFPALIKSVTWSRFWFNKHPTNLEIFLHLSSKDWHPRACSVLWNEKASLR